MLEVEGYVPQQLLLMNERERERRKREKEKEKHLHLSKRRTSTMMRLVAGEEEEYAEAMTFKSMLGIKRGGRMSRETALAVLFFVATIIILSYSTIMSFTTFMSAPTNLQTGGFAVSNYTNAYSRYRSGSASQSASSSTTTPEDTLTFTLPEEVTFSLSPSDSLWIEHLTETPRAFIFHNILTAEECDYIVETQGT